MTLEYSNFIGVEVSPRRTHPFTFAVIDKERVIRSLGWGSLRDVFSFLAGQSDALAAISSPMNTSQELLKREEIRRALNPSSPLSRWANLRLVEYELMQRGIHVPHAGRTRKASPRWMRLGYQLFDEIHKLGYQSYPHAEAKKQYFECQGEAVFWNLLGHSPLQKDTLEGSLQRQLVLGMCGLPVPDAMQFFEEVTRYRLLHNRLPMQHLYNSGELNALAAAYTAWLAGNQPDQVLRLGHEAEGFIYLPDHAVVEAPREGES